MGALSSFSNIDDAAVAAEGMLATGESLGKVWRFAVVQMLDDYESVLHHDGTDAAARMFGGTPRTAGNSQVDAAFAALAEHLARRDGWPAPAWTRDPDCEAMPWWFVTELRGLHPTTSQLQLTGEHPAFGSVTLEQLLATWVAHDLGHIAQITRVMAKQYRDAVGPWEAYLPVLHR